MPLSADVQNVLNLLDQVQSRITGGGTRLDSTDPKLLSQVNNDLNTLLSVLSNPVFNRLCKIQDSVNDLGAQIVKHPSITTSDFDITPEGKLVVKISPAVEPFTRDFDKTPIGNLPIGKKGAAQPGSKGIDDINLSPITTPTYVQEFERVIAEAAHGRDVHSIRLFKPEGSSLGFSVVGLKSQEKGELGIFVQEIQPTGIAGRDGRLAEGDQILAIDGQPLDSAITHQQAIGILQQARGEVEIVVARAPETPLASEAVSGDTIGVGQQPPLLGGERPSSSSGDDLKASDMVLNTEWAQVEVLELINDGTGLGFGIIGGKSTGVVVKTILPGGVADRDGRLQSGDHILQIGDVNLIGMGSDQVASVLRQCGSFVRLVVARPVEPSSPDALTSNAPIVPTKILGDPEALESYLIQSNGYANHPFEGSMGSAGTIDTGAVRIGVGDEITSAGTYESLPEVEIVDVELRKDTHGLGITIAGYVCEKEELSGIFVKSISEGSAADVSGRICINDRIVEVDGISLAGYTNHQAVEVLRKTGPTVQLKLERYHHGSKYDQLQSAISHSEHKPPTPSSVSALSLPQVAVDSDGETEEFLGPGIGEEDEEEDEELAVETRNEDLDLEDLEMLIDTRYEGEIEASVEAAIMAKWSKIMGQDCDIVVSQISKSKEGGGLGISLEGTVDVEDGREVRPHHYIRSVLADGPVGKAGVLLSGDELLEVNGRRLLGLNHVEVVGILKDLPNNVRIVCARRPGQPPPSRPIDTSSDRNAFAARNILGGSLQNLFQGSDRLVKAKSDGSLASTGTTAATETSLSKLKSRSLEPLTGLAMWSSEPQIIELPKGDRGLGFSILDYQDPLNPSETVIVIRSLVPGGVAQQDGRLIPGDRLLAVNEINLENASLDQAVQALKGAPKGVVRIAVAKPLPLPDTTTLGSNHSDEDAHPPPPLPISPPPDHADADSQGTTNMLNSTPSEVFLGRGETPSQGTNQVKPLVVPVATERLIPSYRPESLGEFPVPGVPPTVLTGNLSGLSGTSDYGSIPPLPTALERRIKLRKDEEQLGMTVEVVENGINGVLVTSLVRGSSIAEDGRLRVGDYVVGINNESLRNVTNAQVRAILRRAQLSRDLSISYIPAGDAAIHKETCLIQQLAGDESRADVFPERVSRNSTRTPADGEESIEDQVISLTSVASSPSSTSSIAPTSARSLVSPATPGLTSGSGGAPGRGSAGGSKRDQGVSSPSISSPSAKSAIIPDFSSATGGGSKKHSETSTVYISTAEHGNNKIHAAPQPQVQKRVVTHVTIFPSPPPEVAQVVNVVRRSEVDASLTTASAAADVSSNVNNANPDTDNDDSERKLKFVSSSVGKVTSPTVAAPPLPTTTETIYKSSATAIVTTTSSGKIVSPKDETPSLSGGEDNSVSGATDIVSSSSFNRKKQSLTQEGSGGATTIVTSVASVVSTKTVISTLRIDPDRSSSENISSSVVTEENMVGVGGIEREYRHAPVSAKSSHGMSSSDEGSTMVSRHWGPERLVEVVKEHNKSLGISIVGGKVDLYNAGPDSGSAISGIFIKNVLPNSPAGKTGQLKTGDRILAVDDGDLRSASHERAVEVIRAAGNPVRFLVQSLVQWSDALGVSIDESEASRSEETDTYTTTKSHSLSRISERSTASSRTKSQTDTETTTTSGSSSTNKTVTGTGTSDSGSCSCTENGRGSVISEEDENGSGGSSASTSEVLATERKRSNVSVIIRDGDDSDNDLNRALSADEDGDEGGLLRAAPPPVTPARTPSPELIQPGLGDEEKQEMQAKMGNKSKRMASMESGHSSEDDDELGEEQDMQGKIRTKGGVEIDRASAGHVRRSKEEAAEDSEPEDEFGYTAKKIQKKWGDVAIKAGTKENPAQIVVAEIEKDEGARQGLGISLAGHRDRLKMAVFICGINPAGIAHKTGKLVVGDEILEVNGKVLYDRSHLNASALIKSLPQNKIKIVALRRSEGEPELSVKPITTFPVALEAEKPEDKYANYRGLRVVNMTKEGGLGIMIMEGKHAELGQGIFISDIQEGSIAEVAGLFVGDMILAVNGEELVGVDYEHAANTLKNADGNVCVVVCNATKGEDKDKKAAVVEEKKEPEKPKLPPKPSKIPSPSKFVAAISPRKIIVTPPSATNGTAHPPSTLHTLNGTSETSTGSNTPTSPTLSGQMTPSSATSVTTAVHVPVPSNVQLQPLSPKSHTSTTPVSVSPSASASKMALLLKNRSEEPPKDPATCEIQPGKETTIEINKDKMGLGLSIVGGCDTLLSSIIIHEVYPDGAAAKDGRLKPGDQLLSVNNEDFQTITHNKALAALRQTPTKVKMVVFRDADAEKPDNLYDIMDVELIKKSSKGLGLSIVGRKNGPGVFISDVVPGGTAEADGRLMKGDQIISVNGEDLKTASQEDAAAVLKSTLGHIKMKVGRLKVNKKPTPAATPSENVDIDLSLGFEDEDVDDLVRDLEVSSVIQSSRPNTPPSITGSPPQLRTVVLERGPDGLGFSIVGGYGSPHGNLPIYVKTVFDRGAAAREASLKRGDQILAVDGQSLDGLRHHEAVTILKNAKGNVTLTILS